MHDGLGLQLNGPAHQGLHPGPVGPLGRGHQPALLHQLKVPQGQGHHGPRVVRLALQGLLQVGADPGGEALGQGLEDPLELGKPSQGPGPFKVGLREARVLGDGLGGGLLRPLKPGPLFLGLGHVHGVVARRLGREDQGLGGGLPDAPFVGLGEAPLGDEASEVPLGQGHGQKRGREEGLAHGSHPLQDTTPWV